MTKFTLLAAVAAGALVPFSAGAQDHGGHHGHAPAPQPAPTPEAPGHQHHAPMQDAPVDHSTMDHSTMDHGPHDAHATSDSPGAGSGTARLPVTEGGMHGVHLSTGDWMVMAHGYAPPPIPRRPGRGATIMFSSRRWGC